MKRILLFAALLILAAPAPSARATYYQDSNRIANPGYEQEFRDWTVVENFTLTGDAFAGTHAAAAEVVKGAPALLCTKPYPATHRRLRLQVTFKARGASTGTDPGTGIGLFMVRWLDRDGDRLADTAAMSTDNAPFNQWRTVRWRNPYLRGEGAEQLQVCVRAYAYGAAPFAVTVDQWSAAWE